MEWLFGTKAEVGAQEGTSTGTSGEAEEAEKKRLKVCLAVFCPLSLSQKKTNALWLSSPQLHPHMITGIRPYARYHATEIRA